VSEEVVGSKKSEMFGIFFYAQWPDVIYRGFESEFCSNKNSGRILCKNLKGKKEA
jgi:hypothetical protein